MNENTLKNLQHKTERHRWSQSPETEFPGYILIKKTFTYMSMWNKTFQNLVSYIYHI